MGRREGEEEEGKGKRGGRKGEEEAGEKRGKGEGEGRERRTRRREGGKRQGQEINSIYATPDRPL